MQIFTLLPRSPIGHGKGRKEVAHILKSQSVRMRIKYRKNETEITTYGLGV